MSAESQTGRSADPPRSKQVRIRLDQERIVAAGLDFIDAHGITGLSMRQLGAHLEVKAMALYRYTPSKDDLLDQIVDLLVAQMRADTNVSAARYGWQGFVRQLAYGVRANALDHPRAFPLLALRPLPVPWLRPPLRDPAWVESILTGLSDVGFNDAATVEVYRTLASFLLGHLLPEANHHGVAMSTPKQDTPHNVYLIHSAMVDHTTLNRMASLLTRDERAADFDEGLENLIERFAHTRRS